MSLAGLNILVTRPAGQANGLIAAIKKEGGAAYHYPVLAISALDHVQEPQLVQACKAIIMDLDRFKHVIFVSTNAVRFGMQWIHDYWPQLPVGIVWHAIGTSTARALQAAGVSVCDNTATADAMSMDSEALLQHPALQQVEGDNILIVRGVDGREQLKTQLIARGARVSYAQCYRRTLPQHSASELTDLLKQSIDIICVNSGNSLQNLCTLAGDSLLPALQSCMVIAPGQRVAELARCHGFQQVYVAQNASDEAIVSRLLAVANSRQ